MPKCRSGRRGPNDPDSGVVIAVAKKGGAPGLLQRKLQCHPPEETRCLRLGREIFYVGQGPPGAHGIAHTPAARRSRSRGGICYPFAGRLTQVRATHSGDVVHAAGQAASISCVRVDAPPAGDRQQCHWLMRPGAYCASMRRVAARLVRIAPSLLSSPCHRFATHDDTSFSPR